MTPGCRILRLIRPLLSFGDCGAQGRSQYMLSRPPSVTAVTLGVLENIAVRRRVFASSSCEDSRIASLSRACRPNMDGPMRGRVIRRLRQGDRGRNKKGGRRSSPPPAPRAKRRAVMGSWEARKGLHCSSRANSGPHRFPQTLFHRRLRRQPIRSPPAWYA